jgi:hypothetical protein
VQISPVFGATGFGASALYASLKPHQPREALAVDLTLKFEVIAVCAVFAFVGAILLGAF